LFHHLKTFSNLAVLKFKRVKFAKLYATVRSSRERLEKGDISLGRDPSGGKSIVQKEAVEGLDAGS